MPYELEVVEDAYEKCKDGYDDVKNYDLLRKLNKKRKDFLSDFTKKNLAMIDSAKTDDNDAQLIKEKQDRSESERKKLNKLWKRFNDCVTASLPTRKEIDDAVFLPKEQKDRLQWWIDEQRKLMAEVREGKLTEEVRERKLTTEIRKEIKEYIEAGDEILDGIFPHRRKYK